MLLSGRLSRLSRLGPPPLSRAAGSALPLELRERVAALRILERAARDTANDAPGRTLLWTESATAEAARDRQRQREGEGEGERGRDNAGWAAQDVAGSKLLRFPRDDVPRGQLQAKQWLALHVGGEDCEQLSPQQWMQALELCAERGWSAASGFILQQMRKSGLSVDRALPLALEASAASNGAVSQRLAEAYKRGESLNAGVFDALFRGFRRHGRHENALNAWVHMRELGIWPGPSGLLDFATAACRGGHWRQARDALAEAVAAGVDVPIGCWRSVLRECTYESGAEAEAAGLLDRIHPRITSDFNQLLLMQARAQRRVFKERRADPILARMAEEGIEWDEGTYTALVKLQKTDAVSVLNLFEQAREAGISPQSELFTACACSMWVCSQVDLALWLNDEAHAMGVVLGSHDLEQQAMDAARSRHFDHADRLFRRARQQTATTPTGTRAAEAQAARLTVAMCMPAQLPARLDDASSVASAGHPEQSTRHSVVATATDTTDSYLLPEHRPRLNGAM